MLTVTQDEAIANLPTLIDTAAQIGQELTVIRNNIADAKIVPLPQALDLTNLPAERKPGSAKGMISMRENFDAPLEDFQDYQ